MTDPSNNRPHSKGRPTHGGSVLVAVLGIIAFLSFILLAFQDEAVSKIKYFGLFYNRDDLRVAAYSYFETSLAVINEIREIDRNLHSPTQGWGNPMAYAGIQPEEGLDVAIRVTDESGKFALASIAPATLGMLFDEMGISLTDAQQLTDALLDWMDPDDLTRLNGAEIDFYESSDPPYKPANELIQSWDDLRLIDGFDRLFFDEKGVPTPYLQQFKSAVSLYHNGRVNINSANGIVMAVISRLEGYNTDTLYEYLNGDDGDRGTGDDRLISDRNHPYFPGDERGRSSMVDINSSVFHITVSVNRGESSFLVSGLVSWSGSDPSANARSQGNSSGQSFAKRGETAVKKDAGENLGYPFKIIRITENFKI